MKDDFRDRSHLSSVDGDRPADKPRAGKRRSLQESEQVTCWRCLQEDGIETSATIEMTMAPRRKPDGRKTGGAKAHVCAYCIGKGRITKLIG